MESHPLPAATMATACASARSMRDRLWTKDDAFTFGRVEADDEHVIWPFNGEYWRDELGYYRQVVHSRCGKPA